MPRRPSHKSLRLTRMRQMACHPDLVLRSKTNSGTFSLDDNGEATVCRLCNDIAEDAIQAKCRHIFDRECIKQYLNTAIEQTVRLVLCILCIFSVVILRLSARLPCLPRPFDDRSRSPCTRARREHRGPPGNPRTTRLEQMALFV